MQSPTRTFTTAEAATELIVSPRRVQAMIASGKLKAEKRGRDWIIQEADLEQARERKVGYPKGRPRKAKTPSMLD